MSKVDTYVTTVKTLIAQNGSCADVECIDCPFYELEAGCIDPRDDFRSENHLIVVGAEEYLRTVTLAIKIE